MLSRSTTLDYYPVLSIDIYYHTNNEVVMVLNDQVIHNQSEAMLLNLFQKKKVKQIQKQPTLQK